MKAAGSANDLEVDEADDLFAPEFNETTHGFAVGDVLKRSSASAHAKAQADSAANAKPGISVVVDVEDANWFSAYPGRHAVTITAHGYGAFGTELWLDQSTAGAMTTTKPTSGVRLFLGWVIDTNTIFWDPRPMELI
jgi:hypothetical protein